MHPAAARFVESCSMVLTATRGLDIGGRDVNGSCRHMFAGCGWTVIDINPGPGVDVVADFNTWQTEQTYDLLLCTEVLEHVQGWRTTVVKAAEVLEPEGALLLTCATDTRTPHSAIDGGPVHPEEYYGNVDPASLLDICSLVGLTVERFVVNRAAGDLYLLAVK